MSAQDPAAFAALLQGLLSSENEVRSQAEQAFTELKKYPDTCVPGLVQGLRSNPDPASRSLCAVLLRKVLVRDEPSLWTGLSPASKQLVMTESLNSIKTEQVRNIANKVCDLVSELAAGVLEESGWPELLPFMFQCIQSGEDRLMESALSMFAQLASHIMSVLLQYLGTLHGILAAALAHASTDVRLAAMKATCAFIQELESPAEREKFQALVPALVQTIGHAIQAGDEPAAQEALELFIELAEENPRFLRKQLVDIVSAMLQVAESDSLESGIRTLAVEFLVTLCEAREKAPGMMRRLPQLPERLFNCLMLFLLDVEDVPEWHTAEDEKEENAGEGELFEFGQECLDRISFALGGKTLVPVAGTTLTAYMADTGSWEKRHAALICLAQIAEGCVKVMVDEVEKLVALCLLGARDGTPKVRWAACQALGQLCTDLGPDLQEASHATVVPALLGLMGDFQNPRVQAHACNAIVNFTETCDQDVISPYLDELATRLMALLQGSGRNVQEAALTALASLADCAQEYFIKYYDSCMPLLLHILTHANDRSHHLLRAKSLECISLVGMAVGRERFRAHAHEVMKYMQDAQAAGLEADDPLASYMTQAGARICKTLGQEFIPYLQVVMPALIASVELKPDVTVAAGDDSDVEDEDEDTETFILGDRKISLRTSLLEEKATACSMICCYADELKEGFLPYVQQVTGIMVPLLKFYFNEEVRTAAVQSLPELLRCATAARDAGKGVDDAFVRSMLEFMWTPLLDAMAKEPEQELMVCMLESLDDLLEIAEGPKLLGPEVLGVVFERFASVLAGYEARRGERLARASTEDFDAEEAEALEEEHERESELLDGLAAALSTVLRLYGDAALPGVEGLMPAIGALLGKGRFPEERRIAICMMDDVLEHSPAGAARHAPSIMPLLLAGAGDRDADIRQCSAYGLGVAAARRPEAFRPVAPAALAALRAIVAAPDARADGNASAAENALSALGKVLEHAPDLAEPGLGGAWLAALPLVEDRAEAKEVHAQLLRFIAAGDARVLGEGNANLPQAAKVLVHVLGKGEKLLAADQIPTAVAVLKQMQAAIGAEAFQGLVAAQKPKAQATLQAALAQ
ncbi:IPB2 [Auxenochlorella protothecoides x Auxenochlorella symbiontica]